MFFMENNKLTKFSNAKLNLTLHVTGVKANGFHYLDSLVAFPEIGDVLTFKKSIKPSLTIKGPFADELNRSTGLDENTISRAINLMIGASQGVEVTLTKNLPIAAGIGGGSSNAASTLLALSKLFATPLPRLEEILSLGSDVPVCLSNKLQRMRGVGEKIVNLLSPPTIWVLLANPRVSVQTKKIFRSLQNRINSPLEEPCSFNKKSDLFEYLRRQRNDLQDSTCNLYPVVRDLLEKIANTKDCELSRMSGSGATCFGLYPEKRMANQAVQKLKKIYPNYWIRCAPLFLEHS